MNNKQLLEKSAFSDAAFNRAVIAAGEISSNPLAILTNPAKRKAASGVLNLAFEALNAQKQVIDALLARELSRDISGNFDCRN